MEKIIEDIPKPPASISQAIRSNGLIFVSGQVAVDPETGTLLTDEMDIEAQTERVILNLKMILLRQREVRWRKS